MQTTSNSHNLYIEVLVGKLRAQTHDFDGAELFFSVFSSFLLLLELGFGAISVLFVGLFCSPFVPTVIETFISTFLNEFLLIRMVAARLSVILVVIGSIGELFGFEFLTQKGGYLFESVDFVLLLVLFDQVVKRNIGHDTNQFNFILSLQYSNQSLNLNDSLSPPQTPFSSPSLP